MAYARDSSHGQEADPERQKQVLELHCAEQGWTCEVVGDIGSGMNYDKRGLERLLDGIDAGEVGRLAVTHKDGLLRFVAELVFAICAARRVEVVIVNGGEDTTPRERPRRGRAGDHRRLQRPTLRQSQPQEPEAA